jgi:Carboxypeptidase regulatory-like domain/RTX calcium-binding nonapeptide repeat (4 copies)
MWDSGALRVNDSIPALARPASLVAIVAAALLVALLVLWPPAAEPAGHRCFGKRATIVGTKKGERIRGTRRADVIFAGGGRDRVKGLGGKDRICGGPGKDRALGGAGTDRLDGGGRSDLLIGGPGSDQLRGGPGVDTCNAGSETTLKFTSCERFPLTVTGKVSLDTGGGAKGAQVKVTAGAGVTQGTQATNASGNFTAHLIASRLPTSLTADINFHPAGLPSVRTANKGQARSNTPGIGNQIVPNVAAAELALSGGSATAADGSLEVSGAPPEIDRLFARAYNPGTSADAFPGSFAEDSGLPLNSSLFVWIAALDSAGNPVHNLSSSMTVRIRVFNNQLKDLVDLGAGSDRIEIPIFTFNESNASWAQEGTGWLEDSSGGLIREDAQAEVLGGDFPGEVFARLDTDHLSFVNLDYPYFGPWDISSVDPPERKNECLGAALDLANTILFSQAGQDALKPLNVPGADLKQELPNGVIKLTVGSVPPDVGGQFDTLGWFDPDVPGEIHLADLSLVNYCVVPVGQTSVPDKTQHTMTLMIASVIVHEVAHWKFFNKHEGGDQDESEPFGEAGFNVQEQLFGGIPGFDADPNDELDLELDGQKVPDATVQQWLQESFWPPPGTQSASASGDISIRGAGSPLDMTISLPKANFDLDEQITATVDYHNGSGAPIKVLDLDALEGIPVWFEFVHQGSGETAAFLRGWARPDVDYNSDFTTIGAGQTIQRSFDLTQAGDGSVLYNLIQSGNYALKAHYSPAWGLPAATSNTLNISLNPGGNVSGTIVDETTSLPLEDVQVRAMQGDQVRATVNTDSNGDYSFDELPAGSYSIEAKKLGYLKGTRPNVTVTNGANTDADLTLKPLIASDGIRLVLTWNSGAGDDLDSHLWLPPAKPFHVAYFRTGSLEHCPFANLDIDIISQGGPETTTVGQLTGGDYLYAVNKFSGATDLSQTGAQVKLYDAGGDLLNTYNVPNTGTEEWWSLLQIDGDTGQVTLINALGADPAPYGDTASGCS